MNNENVPSDEPTRLTQIVTKIFRNQPQSYTARQVDPHSSVRLLAGADAQDDCAVFAFRGDQELVVGSDYVRGPKFRLYEHGLLDEYDLGYYLVAANLSDIAAMGARPIGLVSVVRYPPEMSDKTFTEVLHGIRDACADFDSPNVGGDIGGAERLILSATAFGVCRSGRALRRKGARPGDVVCLTSPTGVAAAAMEYFRTGRELPAIEPHRNTLLASWARPQARVREGVCLGESGLVTSCQDTSDGLKATLETLARTSGVGMVVHERDIRVPSAVSAVCQHLHKQELALIMGDSVDFELVFTTPASAVDELKIQFHAQGLDFHTIGRVTAGGTALLELSDGTQMPLPGKEWRHTAH